MLSDPPPISQSDPRQLRRHHRDAGRIRRRDHEFECLRAALRHRMEDQAYFFAGITVARMLRLKRYSSEARRAQLTLQQCALSMRLLMYVLSYLPWLACTANESREAKFADEDEGELPTPSV
jgi:hypothetical protein